ncbi:MAG: EF-P beta-lysylation protein EpmB [Legionellales bacterium]|nr:EF-P beta-lysylation protein EpmB [Legionellales bacterium]
MVLMITRLPPPQQAEDWQQQLVDGFTDVSALLTFLNLPEDAFAQQVERSFPLRVPRAFAVRMCKGDRNDPLLRQVLPVGDETNRVPGFSLDPLSEKQHNPQPGILHKYQGRALVTLTGVCAVHCRYCFRRHFPYADNQVGRKHWPDILAYLQAHPQIHEVILSGGDPLMVQDAILQAFIEQLKQLPQVTTLRIHSRLPIVLPDRVTPALGRLLADSGLRVVMVSHCNHPQEIDESVARAAHLLRAHQIHLLNQAVLLRGVNDEAQTLVQLSKRLWEIDTLPYYLHVLDQVHGAAHFAVCLSVAKQLLQTMLGQLPGYLVPKLVREEAGAASKILISLEQ